MQVVHFTSETKPWNMHYSQHVDFQKNSDPVLYYKWVKMRRTIDQIMHSSQYEEVIPQLDQKCQQEVDLIVNSKSNLEKRFPIEDKFTVLLSTFNRYELVMKLLGHYTKSKYVDHIYVIWHNPREEPPRMLTFLAEQKKNPGVTILKQNTDSLNNKFNPIPELRTRATLIADDDLLVDIRDLDFTFNMWRMHPYSIVGNFPRYHSFNATRKTPWEYHVAEPGVPKTARR